jgi:aflatoxin B1 aldehyde reductase
MYKGPPELSSAIERINTLATEHGISALELAPRWVVHDSPLRKGDAVILGARNEEQLVGNLEAIGKGGLPEGVVKVLDEVWESVREVAPGDV